MRRVVIDRIPEKRIIEKDAGIRMKLTSLNWQTIHSHRPKTFCFPFRVDLVDQVLNDFITIGKLIARLRETVPQARRVNHLE